jgi:hypothetical protein
MAIPLSPLGSNLGAPLTAIGRMQPAVPLLQPSAAGLRGNLCKYTPKRSALILLLHPQGGYRKYVASKLAVFYVQTPSLIRPHITAELTYPRTCCIQHVRGITLRSPSTRTPSTSGTVACAQRPALQRDWIWLSLLVRRISGAMSRCASQRNS